MENLLRRGETIDSLVEKSSYLDIQSKAFYRHV